MNERQVRMIALQASGEYLMKHIAGTMGIVEDKQFWNAEGVLGEETLVTIEAQVKAVAQELIQRSKEDLPLLRERKSMLHGERNILS